MLQKKEADEKKQIWGTAERKRREASSSARQVAAERGRTEIKSDKEHAGDRESVAAEWDAEQWQVAARQRRWAEKEEREKRGRMTDEQDNCL